jgi:C1A family cysteine protease
MPAVFDQGQLGSCTANALAALMEYHTMTKTAGSYETLSRLFIYFQERYIEGTVNQDAGAYARDGFKSLQKIGVPAEKYWPYDIARFTEKPPQEAYDNAGQYKISEYHRVPSLTAYKASLAEGLPVAIGFKVYASFESAEVARTGMVPMPQRGEKWLGGHEVLGVGYDDNRKLVICMNSWGTSWGDGGFFYMPYNVFTRLVMDMWTGK